MAYFKGRNFEYRVKQILLKEGFVVFRFAGSKPLDLMAIKNGKILFCECKTYPPTKEDREKVGAWSTTLGFPVCLYWNSGNGVNREVFEPKLNVANNVYLMLNDFIYFLLDKYSKAFPNGDGWIDISNLDEEKAIWDFLTRREQNE
jgi:Holliday junction resolvase